jgi:hypothetical protein
VTLRPQTVRPLPIRQLDPQAPLRNVASLRPHAPFWWQCSLAVASSLKHARPRSATTANSTGFDPTSSNTYFNLYEGANEGSVGEPMNANLPSWTSCAFSSLQSSRCPARSSIVLQNQAEQNLRYHAK